MSSTSPQTSIAAWFSALREANVVAGSAGPVTTVSADSRSVEQGGLFVAVPGFEVDGHDYIEAALKAGASAFVVQDDRRSKWASVLEGTPAFVVSVPDARVALAQAAAAF